MMGTRMRRMIRAVFELLPRSYQTRIRALINSFAVMQGFLHYRTWQSRKVAEALEGVTYAKSSPVSSNPLQTYFDSHTEGKGIFKWKHYFEIYHRHFSKFIGQEVHVLEIGVYSGGSLEMWKQYFGPKCRIYGVDIEETCKQYADDSVEIFIGDQADRSFWTHFKKEVPSLDIVIDDGGHYPWQQMVTLEELLPHLRWGGVYLCEDVHGDTNRFAGYMNGLALNLNTFRPPKSWADGDFSYFASLPTPFQDSVHSVHLYPFVAVIEKTESPMNEFIAPKRGTEWHTF